MLSNSIKRILLFGFLIFPALSSAYQPMFDLRCLHPVFAFGGGGAFAWDVKGQQTSFPIVDPNEDEYFVYHPSDTQQIAGLFDIFLGAEYQLRPDLAGQLGVDYNQTSTFQDKGMLYQGVPGAPSQYDYEYNINTRQVLLEGKLLYSNPRFRGYHPYLTAGVGTAFNRAYHYQTDIPPFSTFTREYYNHSTRSLAYRLGVGVDIDLSKNLRLGFSYRFADLGTVRLGSSTINDQSVDGTLMQSNLYVNEVLAQLTFIL